MQKCIREYSIQYFNINYGMIKDAEMFSVHFAQFVEFRIYMRKIVYEFRHHLNGINKKIPVSVGILPKFLSSNGGKSLFLHRLHVSYNYITLYSYLINLL